ncbi:MAG: hypothetical protein ACLQGP_41690 [Isosphaeraceae bacterium]
MTFRPYLLLLAACGAFPLIEGTVPAWPASPSADDPLAPAEGRFTEDPSRLRWTSHQPDGKAAHVEAIGIDRKTLAAVAKSEMTRERWMSCLAIRVIAVHPGGAADTPPLLGTYQIEGDVIRFVPRFPLEPGLRYRAVFDPTRLHVLAGTPSESPGADAPRHVSSARFSADFMPPKKPSRSTTTVSQIYPTRERLPENLLRFYIHFSAPMSRGDVYRHIRLLDAKGQPVDTPFLELDEELWSRDGMRFTLLFDPGRIKRGLKPREELGPVLEAGKTYQLVIDRAWPDAEGNPLKAEFRKPLRIGPPDETSPDPKTWDIRPPAPGTRNPLEVCFPEPLDRALLDRLLVVQDAAGKAVAGQVSVEGEETIWHFSPADPWSAGDYRLVIGTELEDPSGNSVAQPFEVDAVNPISRRVASDTVVRPFRIVVSDR